MAKRVIFHIDANSAFLSWTAAHRVLVLGQKEDLRDIPSVVAGDKASRHSIILAKSIPAKKYGIQTGEPLFQAMEKCPNLKVVPPDYGLYVACSRHMIELLRQVAPAVEQYSIDEAWADMTGTEGLYGPPMQAAEMLRKRIYKELGFTVNIGVSTNKLLAKMAGDFEKPNRVHSLFPEEIPRKLWPLPVRDLFLVGAATERKLKRSGITTIGDLANGDIGQIRRLLGKYGETIWHFANGRDVAEVQSQPADNKGYGNSVTLPRDVTDRETAHQVLLSLCETVGMRLRRDHKSAGCISISLRTHEFKSFSHQSRLPGATDVTQELYQAACRVFDEAWDRKTPLRQMGVHVTRLAQERYCQYDLFSVLDPAQTERRAKLDSAVDVLRERFGEDIVQRARFLNGKIDHMAGGLSKERRTGVTKEV
ncbi:MAG: DNA polymerase IV [Faecousia sp.]